MSSTPLFYDLIQDTTTTTGTGDLTLSGTPVAGFRAWSALGNGNSAFYTVQAVDANGIPTGDYEHGIGTYVSSGTKLQRDLIIVSSNSNAAVSFSAGTKRVSLTNPASIATPSIEFGGRLTLVSGNPYYQPQNLTPSSTDTTAETVTFAAAHGWVTGTVVSPETDSGGLTAGTKYYANAASSTSVSFHTTLANAQAGTNKVNLTANVTTRILAYGVSNTTIYYTPFLHNRAAAWNGNGWIRDKFPEISLALGTLTANKPYDVWLLNSTGTWSLELSAAWTDGITRADALTTQDGVKVKSGALTRVHVATVYTDSTTTVMDAEFLRGVSNVYNRVPTILRATDTSAAGHTYASGTTREWNNGSATGVWADRMQFVSAIQQTFAARVTCQTSLGSATATVYDIVGIRIDDTTAGDIFCYAMSGATATFERRLMASYDYSPAVGFHYIAAVERAINATVSFFYLILSAQILY